VGAGRDSAGGKFDDEDSQQGDEMEKEEPAS